MKLRCKRAYETPSPEDGFRVLVDRLWPRGVAKENARIDLWLKEIAPSDELRRWFSHDSGNWEEFRVRYQKELASHDEAMAEIRQRLKEGPVTLVYAARDQEHNNAVVLRDEILGGVQRGR